MIFGINKINNFDPYNVFLAIATNIPQRLKTGFVVQGHICFNTIIKAARIWGKTSSCDFSHYKITITILKKQLKTKLLGLRRYTVLKNSDYISI